MLFLLNKAEYQSHGNQAQIATNVRQKSRCDVFFKNTQTKKKTHYETKIQSYTFQLIILNLAGLKLYTTVTVMVRN